MYVYFTASVEDNSAQFVSQKIQLENKSKSKAGIKDLLIVVEVVVERAFSCYTFTRGVPFTFLLCNSFALAAA